MFDSIFFREITTLLTAPTCLDILRFINLFKVISSAIKESRKKASVKKSMENRKITNSTAEAVQSRKKSIPAGWPRKNRALSSPKTHNAQCSRKI